MKQWMNRAIDNLAEEMGSALFADLVDFDMEISESQFDYKILMGRRFFVLHAGLQPIAVYNYGNELKISGCFVTNLSIALHDLKDKSILIVDDTLLHGRAIKKIVADLMECGCKKENIHVKIYLRNREANIIDQSLLALTDCKRKENTDMWRLVSSKIVDAFMEAGWPYMFYLPYYETVLHSDKDRIVSSLLDNWHIQDHATKTQKKYGISSYLYHDEKGLGLCREILIRIYKYERADKLVVVPYAYLKPLTYSQIAESFQFLVSEGVICFQGNGDFVQDAEVLKTNRLKSQYAYSLLTYVSSLLAGSSFLRKHGMADWKRNEIIEKVSLGCDIVLPEDAVGRITEGLNGIRTIEDSTYLLEENNDINETVDSLINGKSPSIKQRKQDVDYFLDHYLKLSSKRDEQLAKQNKERMRGIEVERIYQYAPNRKEAWIKIQEVIDTGRGTIAISSNVINGTTYVDSLLYAGEQNHACNEENLAELVYPLLQYEMYCREKNVTGQKKTDMKCKIMEAIMGQNPRLRECISIQEIEELKKESFERDYAAYYFDKYAMFRETPGVQRGMKIEKSYEFE